MISAACPIQFRIFQAFLCSSSFYAMAVFSLFVFPVFLFFLFFLFISIIITIIFFFSIISMISMISMISIILFIFLVFSSSRGGLCRLPARPFYRGLAVTSNRVAVSVGPRCGVRMVAAPAVRRSV